MDAGHHPWHRMRYLLGEGALNLKECLATVAGCSGPIARCSRAWCGGRPGLCPTVGCGQLAAQAMRNAISFLGAELVELHEAGPQSF